MDALQTLMSDGELATMRDVDDPKGAAAVHALGDGYRDIRDAQDISRYVERILSAARFPTMPHLPESLPRPINPNPGGGPQRGVSRWVSRVRPALPGMRLADAPGMTQLPPGDSSGRCDLALTPLCAQALR